MDERSSLTSSNTLSSRNGSTLSMTGSNIALTSKPKNLPIRSMKKSHSQPELPTVTEMINARNKSESMWGIANYRVPK